MSKINSSVFNFSGNNRVTRNGQFNFKNGNNFLYFNFLLGSKLRFVDLLLRYEKSNNLLLFQFWEFFGIDSALPKCFYENRSNLAKK